VDASLKAVKSGQTNPAELMKLRKQGVRVFSMPNLHAKVFVFGQTTYVGSTNVSENSEDVYSEASIRSRQTSVVSSARQFVRSLAVNEMGPQKLEALIREYENRKKTGRLVKPLKNRIETRFFIVRLTEGEEPSEDGQIIGEGVSKAKKLMTSDNSHKEMYFWNSSKENRYRPGDTVLPVFTNLQGRILSVEPPAEYLYSNFGSKKRYYYFEQPRHKELTAAEFKKRMPASLKNRIGRAGKVKLEDEIAFRRAFSK
jgi:hypothetical protein